jgi:MT0933-like antitoxin protein
MGIADKAKEFLGEHDDQVDKGLDKGGDMLDERTDGKYSDKIDTGVDKAQEGLGRFSGGDDQ